jgi:uncharacterized membrane protein YeaQ/YmgE (transglycosylase-associated protein family)
MYYVVLIILSLIMGWILQASFKNLEVPGGYWNRFVGAVIGALLGDLILGDWGWMLVGYNVIAGIIGAYLIGWLYIFICNKFSSSSSNDAKG